MRPPSFKGQAQAPYNLIVPNSESLYADSTSLIVRHAPGASGFKGLLIQVAALTIGHVGYTQYRRGSRERSSRASSGIARVVKLNPRSWATIVNRLKLHCTRAPRNPVRPGNCQPVRSVSMSKNVLVPVACTASGRTCGSRCIEVWIKTVARIGIPALRSAGSGSAGHIGIGHVTVLVANRSHCRIS